MMRVLLDECVDPKCVALLERYVEVRHVKDMGWLGAKNGELVKLADQHFDVLFTKDTNMVHQTSLKQLSLTVAYTDSHPRTLEEYRPAVNQFLSVAESLPKGAYVNVRTEYERAFDLAREAAEPTERELRELARDEAEQDFDLDL